MKPSPKRTPQKGGGRAFQVQEELLGTRLGGL